MNKTLDIFPLADRQPVLVNDQINGGRSVGSLSNHAGRIELNCKTIKHPNIFPFCSFILPITDDGSGMNLDSYQSMDIWLQLKTKAGAKDSVLIYLLNSEKNINNETIKRSNMRTINPAPGMMHYSLDIDSFFVPSWWLFSQGDQIKDSGYSDFSNITELQISTGDNNNERSESITIERISFKGKTFSARQVYLLLIGLWIVAISLSIVSGLLGLHRKLNSSNLKTRELTRINNFLSIEKNKYESMAKIDPLTKAFNRAGIRDILDSVVKDYEKNGSPCSIIMIDIDHFKPINDNFGHDIGDKILVNIVNIIKKNARKMDYLARWGGEEFVLICPGTTKDIAIKIAEKHRAIIAASPMVEQAIICTCSFGVSELSSNDITQCFKQADIALYQAKALGRNQVASAG